MWADGLAPPQPGSIPTALSIHPRVVSDTGSPHKARYRPSTCGLMSQPGLGSGWSLWSFLMPGAGAAPVPLDCPVPGWEGGSGSVFQNLPESAHHGLPPLLPAPSPE